MNKKKKFVRPLASWWIDLVYFIGISAIIILFGCIHVLVNSSGTIYNQIAAVFVGILSILVPLIPLIRYLSWKVIAYEDRMEKYNFFNRKKTYYYKDLTVIIKNEDNPEKTKFIYYLDNKKILKHKLLVENGEILTGSYYRYINRVNRSSNK